MALGRFLRGFLASPAAIYQVPKRSKHRGGRDTVLACAESLTVKMGRCRTYSHDLCPDERKRCLCDDSPPTKESTFRTVDVTKLGERTRIAPVAESNSVVVGTSTKVKDNAEYLYVYLNFRVQIFDQKWNAR